MLRSEAYPQSFCGSTVSLRVAAESVVDVSSLGGVTSTNADDAVRPRRPLHPSRKAASPSSTSWPRRPSPRSSATSPAPCCTCPTRSRRAQDRIFYELYRTRPRSGARASAPRPPLPRPPRAARRPTEVDACARGRRPDGPSLTEPRWRAGRRVPAPAWPLPARARRRNAALRELGVPGRTRCPAGRPAPVLRALAQALEVSVRDLRPETLPEPADARASRQRPRRPPAGALRSPGPRPAVLAPSRSVGHRCRRPRRDQVDRLDLAHESRFAELSNVLTELLPQLEAGARATARTTTAGSTHSSPCLPGRRRRVRPPGRARRRMGRGGPGHRRRRTSGRPPGRGRRPLPPGPRVHPPAPLRPGRARHTGAIDALAPSVARPRPPHPKPSRSMAPCTSSTPSSAATRAIAPGPRPPRATPPHRGTPRGGPQRLRHRVRPHQRQAPRRRRRRRPRRRRRGPRRRQVDHGLSPERQARLLIDVARAHTQRRHAAKPSPPSSDAERITPEPSAISPPRPRQSHQRPTRPARSPAPGRISPTWRAGPECADGRAITRRLAMSRPVRTA